MTTAVVGAGVVALGAGAALPEHFDNSLNPVEASADLDLERQSADRASRGGRSGPDSTVNQAPDVWLLPSKNYTLTSLYGTRWGRAHTGIDMGAPEGTPIFAAASGKVILSRYNGGYGNNVVLDHGNGITTVYGHASRLLVKEGQVVRAGDRIALVGNTGHSFGAHLHFEVRIDDKPMNPLPWMKQHGVDIEKRIDATSAA